MINPLWLFRDYLVILGAIMEIQLRLLEKQSVAADKFEEYVFIIAKFLPIFEADSAKESKKVKLLELHSVNVVAKSLKAIWACMPGKKSS